MENGFIKLYRQIQDWEWYTDSATVHFFIHCILSANWKDKRWQGRDVKRGQFVTSYSNLSMQTGLSVKQVRIRIDRLIDSGEIEYEGASNYSVITICKYNTYQPKHEEEGQTKGTQKTHKGQTKGKQRATTKEGKEVEEGKEYKNGHSPPEFSEVKKYFSQKGFSPQLAKKFYNYYNEPMMDRNGRVWKDQNGKTVKSWKQKALAVWMKDDNKKDQSAQVFDGGLW